MSLYDINADSLWVGNLVQTADVANGVLNSIYAKRAPMRISIQGRARHTDGAPLSSAAENCRKTSVSLNSLNSVQTASFLRFLPALVNVCS
jgi:hypothetical protein